MLGMNKLPLAKRVQVLSLLCQGLSMQSISRVADVSINTVSKMLSDAGTACAAYHDTQVQDVAATRVQFDEVWSFCYSNAKNVGTAEIRADGAGDVWTWTAIDPDSKLIVSWLIGGRDADTVDEFIKDLRRRLRDRVQVTTDGSKLSLRAAKGAFGANVDYPMLVKIYGQTPEAQKRYSPPECIGTATSIIADSPASSHISTSYIERQNPTIRIQMWCLTHLTNSFSRKLENHCHALALYFTWYNFARIHKAHKVSPAMAAGVSDRLWSVEDIAALIDAHMRPAKRLATYRKRSMTTEISN